MGLKELELVRLSGNKKFPPRLDWQPVFYPVMNEAYAAQIAGEWNTEDEFSGFAGFVLAFDLPAGILDKYPVQNVGGELHNELWVPADELEEFNELIVGEIRLVRSFYGNKYRKNDQ